MSKKDFIITLLLLNLIAMGVLIYLGFQAINKKESTSDELLFEKNESWGPCPADAICSRDTKIYYSGKMTIKGEENTEEELPEKTISEIVEIIKASDIMNKTCEGPLVLDHIATYKLHIDGKTKEIQSPGCENELKAIENLITGADQPLQGAELR